MQLIPAVAVVGFQEAMQWKFGPLGIACLVLLGIGLKARSTTCTTVGAVVLVLLMTQA
ncbi:hypothetical protein [Streptomyces ureilyticus]|nr:hypothetical protein [Streptomyces ureilyticus]